MSTITIGDLSSISENTQQSLLLDKNLQTAQFKIMDIVRIKPSVSNTPHYPYYSPKFGGSLAFIIPQITVWR